jgi:hypothetical protein
VSEIEDCRWLTSQTRNGEMDATSKPGFGTFQQMQCYPNSQLGFIKKELKRNTSSHKILRLYITAAPSRRASRQEERLETSDPRPERPKTQGLQRHCRGVHIVAHFLASKSYRGSTTPSPSLYRQSTSARRGRGDAGDVPEVQPGPGAAAPPSRWLTADPTLRRPGPRGSPAAAAAGLWAPPAGGSGSASLLAPSGDGGGPSSLRRAVEGWEPLRGMAGAGTGAGGAKVTTGRPPAAPHNPVGKPHSQRRGRQHGGHKSQWQQGGTHAWDNLDVPGSRSTSARQLRSLSFLKSPPRLVHGPPKAAQLRHPYGRHRLTFPRA